MYKSIWKITVQFFVLTIILLSFSLDRATDGQICDRNADVDAFTYGQSKSNRSALLSCSLHTCVLTLFRLLCPSEREFST